MLSQYKSGASCEGGIKVFLYLAGLLLLVLTTPAYPRTWHITPDGLGDAPTIQAGIDSAVAGDTVLVACGTYYEYGIEMKSGISLVSATGDPSCVTIDADRQDRVIVCENCNATTLIHGFTLTRGMPQPPPIGYGGGVFCFASSVIVSQCLLLDNYADSGAGAACAGGSPSFIDCTFRGNISGEGGGVFCTVSSPSFVRCVFAQDSALFYGGGLCCETESNPTLTECTFYGCAGGHGGGGVHCFESSSPTFERTIIAFSTSGEAVTREREDCNPQFACCDIYGNDGGDWVGCISDQMGSDGNFSADPLFCDVSTGNFGVEECSPCLVGNHPGGYECGGTIGASAMGCVCGAQTEQSTWGAIKGLHR